MSIQIIVLLLIIGIIQIIVLLLIIGIKEVQITNILVIYDPIYSIVCIEHY